MNSGMKEKIIDGARELFSKHGYSGVRVDDIAQFVGISKKTIYNHFPNKFSLIWGVIDSNTLRLCRRLDESFSRNGKSPNWLERIYDLIILCCQTISEWVFNYGEYNKNKELKDIMDKSLEQIRRKIMDLAKQFLNEDIKNGATPDDGYSKALFSLCAAVVEGVFNINVLCSEDKLDQNPLIRNLRHMSDVYLFENSLLSLPSHAVSVPETIGYAPQVAQNSFGSAVRSNNIFLKSEHKRRTTPGEPTYDQLKQHIKVLEKESAEHKQVEDDLRRSKDRLSLAMEISEAIPWEINLKTCRWQCDAEDYETYRHETKEAFEETVQLVESILRYLKGTVDIVQTKEPFEIPVHPEDRDKLFLAGKAVIDGEKSAYEGDHRMFEKDGEWAWYYGKAKVTKWDKAGNPEILSGITIDITERKKVEETLRIREAKLASQTHALEETNTALKVLLKSREEDRKEFEKRIITNLKEMVFPFIEKLRSSRLDERQMVYLDIIKSHIEDMTAPFLRRLSSKYSGLTPAEVKVAVFVKEGKTTKEIAGLLNSSIDAVNFHRNNLRKKFDLVNSKTNLRTFLSSLS